MTAKTKLALIASAALAAGLLVYAASAAQPPYDGAPRGPKLWTAGDPAGLAQLKYLADRDATAQAYDAALAAAFASSNEVLAAADRLRPTFEEGTNLVVALTADRPTFEEGTNLVAALTADRPTFEEGTNLVSALALVSLFPQGDLLYSDGTNLFYVSADGAFTNALTANAPE